MHPIKPFPLPVVAALGPGSQAADDAPGYLPMPQGMSTYQTPSLPEPEEMVGRDGALSVLRQVLDALRAPETLAEPRSIDLAGLAEADRVLLNQVLGEGEVAAQVVGEDGVRVQESVFAGVWRVLRLAGGQVVRDTLEVGTIPQALVDAAALDAMAPKAPAPESPPDLMNAPAVLSELADRRRRWRPGVEPHVTNLTLLPLTPGDSIWLDAQVGTGRVVILSRGYGNCRIASTSLAHTWRVTYFNSTDIVILDTLEVCRVPEVACAAAEDLADSAERIEEVLQWVEAP